jgi:hypothetical protein
MMRSVRYVLAAATSVAMVATSIPQVTAAEEDAADRPLHAVAQAGWLREAYLARNLAGYRVIAFDALAGVRRAGERPLQEGLTAVADDVRRNGADGVEPLLLALADALATRGSPAGRRHAATTLQELAPGFAYRDQSPAPNMKIPIARGDGYLALDVQPRVARVIAAHAVRPDRGELRTLIELLDTAPVRGDLCDLPAAHDASGTVVPADAQRQQSCDQNGFAGTPGSGTVGEALGGLVESGCNLSTPSQLVTLQNRAAALEACMEERAQGGGPLPDVALAPVVVGIIAGAAVVVALALAYVIYTQITPADGPVVVEYIPPVRAEPAKTLEEELLEANRAAFDAEAAVIARDEAADAYEAAVDELATALENLAQAEVAVADAEQDGTDEQIAAARAARQTAQDAVTIAQAGVIATEAAYQRKKEEAAAARGKAEREMDEAKNKVPKDLPDGDAWGSPSCRAALGDLNDRLLREKLSGDWITWGERLGQRRLDPRANWSPDGDSPYNALGTPICGADHATLDTATAACPVLCEDGLQCGCGAGPDPLGAVPRHLVSRLQANACTDVHVECPNGQAPRGLLCECAPPEGGAGSGPWPPKPEVVDTLFGTSDVLVDQDATVQAVRSLFDGRARLGRPEP